MIDGKTNSSHQVSPTLESNLVISCFWTSSQRVRRLSQLWKLNLTGTSLRRPGRQLWRSFQVREFDSKACIFKATPPKTDHGTWTSPVWKGTSSSIHLHFGLPCYIVFVDVLFCRLQFLCLSLQRSSKGAFGIAWLAKTPKAIWGSCDRTFQISKGLFPYPACGIWNCIHDASSFV